MIVIACVDDALGMMFNHRRISQDQAVRRDIKDLVNGESVWMDDYSSSQFTETNFPVKIRMDLSQVKSGEYCFIEKQPIHELIDQIEQVVLYRWNRKYPSDQKLDINLKQWRRRETKDFKGKSHEKITREIYIRN